MPSRLHHHVQASDLSWWSNIGGLLTSELETVRAANIPVEQCEVAMEGSGNETRQRKPQWAVPFNNRTPPMDDHNSS